MADEPSVFSANTLTTTTGAAPESGADSHAPISGSTIINTTFLGGAAEGQHQDTVTSHDQTVKVDKSRRTTITEDEELTIIRHQTRTVGQNEYLIVGRH